MKRLLVLILSLFLLLVLCACSQPTAGPVFSGRVIQVEWDGETERFTVLGEDGTERQFVRTENTIISPARGVELDGISCVEFGMEVEVCYEAADADAPIPADTVLVTLYEPDLSTDAKPVIYLYPTEETEVTVRLDYAGQLTTTWPVYEDGWTVTAAPDGTLTDADGREYSYLFWEGVSDTDYDLSEGFVVAGPDTGAFLREALSRMGLTPREYNEFIVYWLPLMEGNDWNLISFQQERYTDAARLEITPQPDSLLRVFMAWMPLEQPVEVVPQTLTPFTREGFTVVEWGGTQVTR